MNCPSAIWNRAIEEVDGRYGYSIEYAPNPYQHRAEWEREAREIVVREVEAYVQAGTGQRGSMTMQTRRVVKALLLIGLARTEFSARTERKSDGTYGTALGSVRTRHGARLVIDYAELLVAAGLRVYVTNQEPGAEGAFVGSADYEHPPAVVTFASVEGRDLVNPAYAVPDSPARRALTD